MPKIKITNLKPGAIVINSLKITIPGKSSVTRDASVMDDPDLIELENDGFVSISQHEAVPTASPKQGSNLPSEAPQGSPSGVPPKKLDKPKKQQQKPGTSFRMNDGPEDAMGRRVTVMGENGPEIKKMSPGINGGDGPKFGGDDIGDDVDLPSEDGVHTI